MPLLDHFHPPLSKRRRWTNLHSGWANALRDQLNEDLLPPGYVAEVQIKLGVEMELDVATLEESGATESYGQGGIAVWAPPSPSRTVLLDFTQPELFEVQVVQEDEGLKLVAAIELVSPANKDRASPRQAFAVKCASFLQQGINLVVVDVVTHRQANLHGEMVQLLPGTGPRENPEGSNLYAAAYRTVPLADATRLEYWWQQLALDQALPVLPLWIGPDQCLPLDLEYAYITACTKSRI